VKTFSKNLPAFSLGKIDSRKGPLTFFVAVDGVLYRRHQDHILDAEDEVFIKRGEKVEDADVEAGPIPFQSPARRPVTSHIVNLGVARAATPISIVDLESSDNDEDAQEVRCKKTCLLNPSQTLSVNLGKIEPRETEYPPPSTKLDRNGNSSVYSVYLVYLV